MAHPMKAHLLLIGKIGTLRLVELPWPVKVQIVDVRESFGQIQYLIADASTDSYPAAWIRADRVMGIGEGD